MNIGIDMMGGDFAPLEAVKGVQQYLTQSEHNIFCIGEETLVESIISTTRGIFTFFAYYTCIRSNWLSRASY